MTAENLPMPITLPQTDEPKKKVEKFNCLQEILAELMSERSIEMAEIVKATGIKFPTLHDWVKGNVQAQMVDKNLLKLAQFFNVSLEYLCFGIGDPDEAFEKFKSDTNH